MSFGLRSSPLRNKALEMIDVVVAEDHLLGARLAHALDHRIVVLGIRKDEAARKGSRERRDAGCVRHIARGEDERCFLGVQIRKLALELDDRRVISGDVARAAGADAHGARGLAGCLDHLGVAAHAEIIVRAPDGDASLAARAVMSGEWRLGGFARELGEDAVAAFGSDAVEMERRMPPHSRMSRAIPPSGSPVAESALAPDAARSCDRAVRRERQWATAPPGAFRITAPMSASTGPCDELSHRYASVGV